MGNVLTDRSIIALLRCTLQLLLIVFPVAIFAQTTFVIRPTLSPSQFDGMRLQLPEKLGRPKVGLVLSGGGGRGLAQIGVLRALEKNHIPIDLIIGNSLGSVIGGLLHKSKALPHTRIGVSFFRSPKKRNVPISSSNKNFRNRLAIFSFVSMASSRSFLRPFPAGSASRTFFPISRFRRCIIRTRASTI